MRHFDDALRSFNIYRGDPINQFGGSHAQRDVIDWTLTEAAIRSGMRDIALALSHERLALKPHSPVNREFVRRAGVLSDAPAAAAV